MGYNIAESNIDAILNRKTHLLNIISRLIPDNSRILDIGYDNGILAILHKALGENVHIEEIEPDETATEIVNQIYVGLIQDFVDKLSWEKYGFIILADMLEHMPDPLALLTMLHARIDRKVKVIISLTNIAHGSVRLNLL